MAPQKVINNIPTNTEADQKVQDFESEGCTAVKTKQENGKYTVTANCPEPSSTSTEIPKTTESRKELRNIPPDKVGQIVSDFESEGAETEKTKQADGNFTVVAKFP